MAYNPEYHREYYQRNKERKRLLGRAWELSNPEKVKAYRKKSRAKFILSGRAKAITKAWEARNRERILWRAAQARARAKNQEFTISLSDIVIPDVCPILGIPINRDERGRMQPNSPSLDRIDNSKGYMPGNVWVISWKANRIKCDASLEEIMLFCANLPKLIESRTIQRLLGKEP